ncbi:DNA polymerase [Neorhizobium sp. S3-V5DH]|uniref:DNA polymerase n=1 Tax=Neorhizobium sp. S3-V5DH TaxID=2485166 RepID=UPI0010D8C8A0|nr:DNA polymerase [Neorhizobium sp. S3-V5DH]TCV62322.1 DNA polymerase I-like protein with 3'-5' exonuclease and polymerase domains [Neorhizobium sp. S3-V5DH]
MWEVPNPKVLVFDIETDGLIPEMTVVHSLVIKDVNTGEVWSCSDNWKPNDPERFYRNSIEFGLRLLMEADIIVGHNIVDFDIPAIQKLYPWFKPKGLIRDTIIMSRLMYADMKDADFRQRDKRQREGKQWIAPNLFGRHSLESWGQRLGIWKGDYGDIRKKEGIKLGLKKEALTAYVWGTWSLFMQEYCEQDVEVTTKLWLRLIGKGFSEESIQLEHMVRHIVSRQERYGFAFDEKKAAVLYAKLAGEKASLEAQLAKEFAPWFRFEEEVEVSKSRSVKREDLGVTVTIRRFGKNGKELAPYIGPVKEHYEEGATYSKVKLKPFNPGSRHDIANRLQTLYGWKPKEFTDDGSPKVDEEVLKGLKFPAAKVLFRYLLIQKRIGQLAEGKEAWLKHVRNGRIHGQVNTNGAVTGRMTHSKPNMAQVPSGRAPFGHECRELFMATAGKLLVGCDADALELRDLAGYMAAYDGGAYIKTVLEGKKEDGTDMHTQNAKALGCDRDTAKTWFYAFIYGSGDFNLGCILGVTGSKQKITAAGRAARARFLKALPALSKLIEAVKKKAEKNGFLKGLDGRKLTVRSGHAALNTLLQSAGAIQMKRGLVILDQTLQSMGLIPGVHYEFVGNIHDEWQLEVDEDKADLVGRTAADAIRLAGEYYKFRCHLAGNYDKGKNWAETH